MNILLGLVGMLAALGLMYVLSNDKKAINFKAIGIMMVLQIGIALVMFKTTIGMKVIEAIGNGVNKVMSFGYEGINFVVGGWVPEGQAPFFVNVLLIIVFTSVLLSILTHIKVLPLAVKYIGGALAKITGLSKLTTFHAIQNIFFGQSEGLLAIKSHIQKANDNKLFVLSVSSMASVSAGIMAAYMTMIPAEYVLGAMVLNALSGLILGTIIAPDRTNDGEIELKEMSQTKSIFEAISFGALDGGKVALIVGAMLIAYVGLIALIDGLFAAVIGLTFSEILGYVFAPIAIIMGVPFGEALTAGQIMGVKLATNEFVAMLQFMPLIPELTEKTVAVVSVFLVSFANFSSIGIIGGTIQAISGEKASIVAKFGLKMLLVATLVSVFTAALVGLFV